MSGNFDPPATIKGASVCIQIGQKSRLTYSPPDKVSLKFTIRHNTIDGVAVEAESYEFIDQPKTWSEKVQEFAWYYLPVDLDSVSRCSVTGTTSGEETFRISSLLFTREEISIPKKVIHEEKGYGDSHILRQNKNKRLLKSKKSKKPKKEDVSPVKVVYLCMLEKYPCSLRIVIRFPTGIFRLTFGKRMSLFILY
ncbi:hypothetical protein ADUPG1_000786 [Aduncisulcus paluster]|uniref:Arrestin-like N-terminal domain-containing protein n=1 Tax=Aduncisulcus paluster TaxID=2918883 RepID=A0ABQ5K7X1_9EUKA|nr:hypothetical protein ADUPG1_000786 [Aduncisulcus paluster]